MTPPNLADIRLDYGQRGLSPEDCDVDPLVQLQSWLNEALSARGDGHEPRHSQ